MPLSSGTDLPALSHRGCPCPGVGVVSVSGLGGSQAGCRWVWEPSHTARIPVPANPPRLRGTEAVRDPRPLPAPCSSDARARIGCNHQEEPSGRGEPGLAAPGPACTSTLPGLVVPGLAGSRGAGASTGVPTWGKHPCESGVQRECCREMGKLRQGWGECSTPAPQAEPGRGLHSGQGAGRAEGRAAAPPVLSPCPRLRVLLSAAADAPWVLCPARERQGMLCPGSAQLRDRVNALGSGWVDALHGPSVGQVLGRAQGSHHRISGAPGLCWCPVKERCLIQRSWR